MYLCVVRGNFENPMVSCYEPTSLHFKGSLAAGSRHLGDTSSIARRTAIGRPQGYIAAEEVKL